MCYVHVHIPHDECIHYVPQTCINSHKKWNTRRKKNFLNAIDWTWSFTCEISHHLYSWCELSPFSCKPSPHFLQIHKIHRFPLPKTHKYPWLLTIVCLSQRTPLSSFEYVLLKCCLINSSFFLLMHAENSFWAMKFSEPAIFPLGGVSKGPHLCFGDLLGPYPGRVGMYNSISTLENSLAVPPEVEYRATIPPATLPPYIKHKSTKNRYPSDNLYSNI